jgi:hypothetical protein
MSIVVGSMLNHLLIFNRSILNVKLPVSPEHTLVRWFFANQPHDIWINYLDILPCRKQDIYIHILW